MIDLIKDFLYWGGAITGVMGIGSYTYLFPIYYFALIKKLDKHYQQTETVNHPLFPKSTLLRMAIYCSSIISYKWTMKGSLNEQFFGDDFPRKRCNKFQVFLAYYSMLTALTFTIIGCCILIFDFIIAPLIGTTPVMQ